MDRSRTIKEEIVEKRLKRRCEKLGWLCLKLDPTAKKGIPDRMVVAHGIVAFVELKRPKGGRLEPLQVHWQSMLASLGHPTFVAHNAEEVDAVVEWIRAREGRR